MKEKERKQKEDLFGYAYYDDYEDEEEEELFLVRIS